MRIMRSTLMKELRERTNAPCSVGRFLRNWFKGQKYFIRYNTFDPKKDKNAE